MLKELTDFLMKKGAETARPQVLQVDGEAEHLYWLVRPDGQIVRHEKERLALDYKADDLDTLAEVVLTWHGRGGVDAVWIQSGRIVAYRSEDPCRDRVTMTLDYSEVFRLLSAWAVKTHYHTQKDFCVLLRTTLCKYLRSQPAVLNSASKIKFKRHEDGDVELQKDKASVGRSIKMEMSGAGGLPDDVEFELPVFASPHVLVCAVVKAALILDLESEKLAFVPLPGEIENARHKGDSHVRNALHTVLGPTGIPVRYGAGS